LAIATRPATSAAPRIPAFDVPAGFWQREASHFPKPLAPMTRSLFLGTTNRAFRNVFADFGMLVEGLEMREIGGWVYNRMVPLGGKDRRPPPKWLFWLLVRTAPAIRARIARNLHAIREDLSLRQVELWHGEWRADQQEKLARFRACDLDRLDDAEMLAILDEMVAFYAESVERHFRLTPPMLLLAELIFFCRDRLGWDEIKAFDLMAGYSGASTAPARALAGLTAMAAARPALRALIERDPATAVAEIPTTDPEFALAFEAYQEEFGYRALRYEVQDAALIEEPALTLALIRDQLARGYDPAAEEAAARFRRERAEGEARSALAGDGTALSEFERLLARARLYYPVREENEFYTISAPLALMRFACLALGRRLVARGLIDAPDDVFWLEIDEARSALREGLDARPRVAAAKAERAGVLANPGPPSYGTPPADPPLDALPATAALTMRTVMWAAERVFEERRSQQRQANSERISGIPAAPGTYRGPVRVVLDESEFAKIQPGDVLVCPITSPVWSVLFTSVGALVTDSGGVLSHPAIIAREYGIPAVVATGNATALLRDGQTVLVDGRAGTVVVG
jgi:pyruvate,water dikinase